MASFEEAPLQLYIWISSYGYFFNNCFWRSATVRWRQSLQCSSWDYSQWSYCNLISCNERKSSAADSFKCTRWCCSSKKCRDEQDPTPFVPSLGAWSKRLVFQFSPPRTPPEPSTPRNYNPELVQSQIENFWPSLEDGINLMQKSLWRKEIFPRCQIFQFPSSRLQN